MVDNTESYNGNPSLTNSKHYSHNSHRDTQNTQRHTETHQHTGFHADREGCCSFPQPGMQALIGDWKHLEGDNQWKRKRERQTHKHTHTSQQFCSKFIVPKMVKKLNICPGGGDRWKVRGMPKIHRFILWAPWISAPNHTQSTAVDIFQCEPKWLTDYPTDSTSKTIMC